MVASVAGAQGLDPSVISIIKLIGGSGNDNLVGDAGDNIISGLGGNDTLIGNDGDDTLASGGGDDFLSGGNGNDELFVGDGDDILLGGEGADSFYRIIGISGWSGISVWNEGVTTIMDFDPLEDKIGLIIQTYGPYAGGFTLDVIEVSVEIWDDEAGADIAVDGKVFVRVVGGQNLTSSDIEVAFS